VQADEKLTAFLELEVAITNRYWCRQQAGEGKVCVTTAEGNFCTAKDKYG
jgi:hypothetical protein